MKTITLIAAFCACSLLSLAQQEESTFYRPLQGDKALSFNITGLANLTLNSTQDPLTDALLFDFRYFYKDNLAFRLGLGLNNISATITNKSNPLMFPVAESEIKSSGTGFNIGLGVEKHVKTKSKKMDPFVGVGIYIGILGDSTINIDSKSTLNSTGDYTNIVSEEVIPGGFALGLGINGGFFWYFAQNIALGGELSIGYVSGHFGGDESMTSTTTNSTSGVITTSTSTSTSESKTNFSAFNTINTGSINLLVKF